MSEIFNIILNIITFHLVGTVITIIYPWLDIIRFAVVMLAAVDEHLS